MVPASAGRGFHGTCVHVVPEDHQGCSSSSLCPGTSDPLTKDLPTMCICWPNHRLSPPCVFSPPTLSLCLCVCTHMCTCMCVHMHAHAHASACLCVCLSLHLSLTLAYLLSMSLPVCLSKRTYEHVFTHTHTFMDMCTHMQHHPPGHPFCNEYRDSVSGLSLVPASS